MKLINHPNFKHIIKNRRPETFRDYFYATIKNEEGKIWNSSSKIFEQCPSYSFAYHDTDVFQKAEDLNCKAYLETAAGSIEIHKEDFQ